MRNGLYKSPVSTSVPPSLFAMLLSASLLSPLSSLLSPLSVSYYLSSPGIVFHSTTPPTQPNTAPHRPPQNIFTLWRTRYHGSRIRIPRHFLQIPLFSCLLWVTAGWCYGVAIFTWLKLAVGWTSPNLSYQFLVKNGINTRYSVLQYIILKLKLNRR